MRLPLFALFLIYQPVISAQQLFVQPYPIEVYKRVNQNWAIAQEQSILYFANNDGVLSYHGTTCPGIEDGGPIRLM